LKDQRWFTGMLESSRQHCSLKRGCLTYWNPHHWANVASAKVQQAYLVEWHARIHKTAVALPTRPTTGWHARIHKTAVGLLSILRCRWVVYYNPQANI
jgi:hypothetical protein